MAKQDIIDQICNEILSQIEIREARTLNWGFYQAISQELRWLDGEIRSILGNLSPRLKRLADELGGFTTDQVIQNLVARKLIFDNGIGFYRSRFAETIRLLYLLRQRFGEDDWNDGARLISDIKIHLKRRRFPNWNIKVDGVVNEIPSLTDLQKEVIHQLTGSDLLAKFQVDAFHQILSSLSTNVDCAIAIGAGTGAGKTRAFYTPALAHISQYKVQNSGVQAIALYPRVELLKDQFRETFQEARKLDSLLQSNRKEPIRIGAYYGDVPRTAMDFSARNMSELNWRRTREDDGWVCPYMVCPYCGKGFLAWSDEHITLESKNSNFDLIGKYEILECLSCHKQTTGDVLPLTRDQLLRHPPDILFTTTETLNRRLSDPGERYLFGVGVKNPPRLLLMDEIHLNEGFHGAQVAYLFRRWRFARGNATGLCVVGLSATVTQAELFFGRLTGISNVGYITPSERDLIDEGLEYNLVVRGDMSSGTTLLSSSVRTIMLLGRTLDPLHGIPVSKGAWGQRIFAFSDKLDSINRWYHILKEVENPRQPYAQWRFVDPKKNREAYQIWNEAGQNWWITTQIDPDSLKTGLILDITSSQYRGVNPRANIVIASSTLEVGYNDPKVGAIVQHKAPRSQASFLQRKGRAGRPRSMRPWTIVVTSSFGRDRWAYQHAETLFEPLIPPIELPIENYYVRKAQAVFALMDWLASELQSTGHTTSLWTLLGSKTVSQQSVSNDSARRSLCQLLEKVLKDKKTRTRMTSYVQGALNITDDHILQMLLWGTPRSIMLDVVPSVLRQLQTNWQKITFIEAWQLSEWDDYISEYPLPEFIPQSLFSDLNVPEILINIPEKPNYKEEERKIRSQEALGLTLGMLEFTPGKVNKRFAYKDRISESHWLTVPNSDDNQIEISDLEITFASSPYTVQEQGQEVLVYRPQLFNLRLVPRNIRPTSNAFHQWNCQFVSRSLQNLLSSQASIKPVDGATILLDKLSPWAIILKEIKAYTHAEGKWVESTRYTTATTVYTRYEEGFEVRRTITYKSNEAKAALGFQVDVDAIHFRVSPFDYQVAISDKRWPAVYRQLKPHFFRHKLGLGLREQSRFELDWIWQIELSMIIERAVALEIDLQQAVQVVHNPQHRSVLLSQQLNLLFETVNWDDEGEETDGGSYLREKLYELLLDPFVAEKIQLALTCLWNENDADLEPWIHAVYLHSLGAAVYAAIVDMVPEIDTDDLHLDIQNDGFWISELTAGGVGLISQIVAKIHEAPHRFDTFVQHTIQFCEREHLATQLNNLAEIIQETAIRTSLQAIRATKDLHHVEDVQKDLSAALSQYRIAPTRNVFIAINTRFLRPNSDIDTDELIQGLSRFWREQQERLDCEIDIRVIAAAAVQTPTIQKKVNAIFGRMQDKPNINDGAQTYNLLESLLWLNCHDSCPDCIEKRHQFQESEKTSRYLLQLITEYNNEVVAFSTDTWKEKAAQKLIENYRVLIECEKGQVSSLHSELLQLISKPVDFGYISLYPDITKIHNQAGKTQIEVSLTELLEST